MRFPHHLFVVSYLVSVLVCLASAHETYLSHKCVGDSYTSNSSYQKNLNSLLSSLSSNNDINYGFYNFSQGDGTDRVNAIALCRGDIGQAACQNCVNFSTTDLRSRCLNGKEGIVWYDNCMLRYSNKSIFGSLEDPVVIMWNRNNVSDVNLFSQALNDLLSRLRGQASAGDSRVKFAIGNTSDANITTIYGLVQCTPDLRKSSVVIVLVGRLQIIQIIYLGSREEEFLAPVVISDMRFIRFMKSHLLHLRRDLSPYRHLLLLHSLLQLI